MRIPKVLNIDRFAALQQVVYHFVCMAVCGQNYHNCRQDRENCERIARVNAQMNEVMTNLDSPIIKEVAILTNGFHEDN